jgi:hypothetical protein
MDIAKLHEALLSPSEPAPPKAESPIAEDSVTAELHMLLTGETAPPPLSSKPAAAQPVAKPAAKQPETVQPAATQPATQPHKPHLHVQRPQQAQKPKKAASLQTQEQSQLQPEPSQQLPSTLLQMEPEQQSWIMPDKETIAPKPESKKGWAPVQSPAVKSLATIVAEEEVRRRQEEDAQAAKEQAEHAAMMAALVDERPAGWTQMDPAIMFVGEKRSLVEIQLEELALKRAQDEERAREEAIA